MRMPRIQMQGLPCGALICLLFSEAGRTKFVDGRQPFPYKISHYGVTGSMRWSWVRLSLFEEL
jgi:hypothetical protein